MRNPSRRFALVYAAVVLLVCFSVIAGPAGGGVISNLNMTFSYANAAYAVNDNIATFSGSGLDQPFTFSGELDATNPNHLVLSTTVNCQSTSGPCSKARIGFDFVGSGYPASQQFQLSLIGSSTSAVTAAFFGYVSPGTERNQGTEMWVGIDLSQTGAGAFSLTSDPLVMDLTAPPEGSFYLWGWLNVWSLGPGATLSIPGEGSADISITTPDAPGVPEPGSALLLLGGFSLLEFLRRKVRG
jgi:hypothetical protein